MGVTRTQINGGVAGLRRKFAQIQQRMADVRPAFPDMHAAFLEDEQQLFDTRGASGAHGAWPANRPATITAKGHAQVLRGKPSEGWRLESSCVNALDVDHVYFFTSTYVEMGTAHWKASIHQRGRGRVPIRRVVDPTHAQKLRYVRIISVYIVEGVLGAE